MTAIVFLTIYGVALLASLYVARLAGGSWGWASWGIFGPLGWVLAFALSGAMKAHEAADRRARRRSRPGLRQGLRALRQPARR